MTKIFFILLLILCARQARTQAPLPAQTQGLPAMPQMTPPPLQQPSVSHQPVTPPTTGIINISAGNYTDTTINGWKIKINSKLSEGHRLMRAKALHTLSIELDSIEKKLPSDAIPYLKEMSIWLEFSTPNNAAVQYHTSAEWLARNGYDTRKESSVEIVAVDYVNLNHKTMPLLEPFAAAFHQRVLGLNNRTILTVFEHAKTIKLYADTSAVNPILFHNANDYFAAISSAYYGEIDSPPYNKSTLRSMDPDGYALVEKLWKADN